MHPLTVEQLSAYSTRAIAAAAVVHALLFAGLWWWSRRVLRRLVDVLDDFTRGLKHRSVLDRSATLSEQVDAFLADVREVLEAPNGASEKQALAARLKILDEKRADLRSMRFETVYSMARTMVEAYPLAGVLGTILAIGAALQLQEPSVSAVVERFGEAIWSTFAGLVAAIVLMFVNSVLEPGLLSLTEHRRQVRAMIARAKHVLCLPEQEGS
ncbi:MAG: MotA/TolQ/ExbB proton channel [Planctomycetota bacterium]|nr:MAG: MotA/TolQ/ExbB proton channel [Planctomycetota bacterium]